MKNKIKINEDNYKEVVLKRAIIICWILLLACFAIKIFGGNYFAVACTNEKFVRVCEFIDNSIIKYVIYYLLFNVTMYLMLMITSPNVKVKSKKFLLFLIIVSLTWIYKLLLDLGIITLNVWIIDIIDFSFYFVVLLIMSKKPIRSLFALVLLFAFTMISASLKDIGMYGVVTDSYIVASIISIDYYIMLTLSALHSKQIYNRRQK